MNGDDSAAAERQSLLSRLLDAIKQCQIRFGGRTELATESDSRVVCLCAQFEAVLQHGIQKKGFSTFRQVTEIVRGLNLKNAESEPTFWNLVTTVLNRHEYERYMLLKNITTDTGRGRAWLRSALNEHSLERYMHMILADSSIIGQYYEDWAFLMDQERSSMLPMMAAGLGSILFAVNIDNPDLNTPCIRRQCTSSTNASVKPESSEPQPVIAQMTNSTSGSKKKRKKKRPTSQFVSFDDDDVPNEADSLKEISTSYSSSRSAPPTCLSSPVSLDFPDVQQHTSVNGSDNQSANMTLATSDKRAEILGSKNVTVVLTDSTKKPEKDSDICNNATGPFVDTSSSSSSSEMNPSSRNASGDSTIDATKNSAPVSIHVSKFHDNIEIPHTVSPDTKHQFQESSSISKYENLRISERYLVGTVLTPLGDNSVGELIPVSQIEDIPSSEDSVSIPSFGEDTENAAAALAFAQKVAAWATSTSSSDNTSHNHLSLEKNISEPRSRADTMTMSTDDLREALFTVMQRKEEVEEKNNSLRSLLDREMEINAALRAEIEAFKLQQDEKVNKLENTIQTLTRENDVLKHQLKKYIAAVQMLKRDSGRAQENFSSIIGEIQPAIPEPKSFIDHQFEASEYEKKLVQVAEMHGELMEFNDRLHKLLLQREATIRRLKEELIDLRGPLPDDNQTSDDDISVTSDYDASSQTALSRPLINIWIPSAFLTGRASDVHHVYQMYVRIRDEEWNIYRRYAQFYAFHKVLKKKHPIVNTFDFPPKKTIGSKDAKVVEERRKRIQHYMRCVVNWLLQSNVDLANNPDRETLITLLPFLGDSNSNEQKTQCIVRTGSRLRLPTTGNSVSSTQDRPAQQHYTGL